MADLRLTVVVPAYNEQAHLGATLAAVCAQTEPADRVIVVDDCSSDLTGEIARGYGAEVLRPPANLGSKARAQNYALPHVRTELVLPVDADTVLAPDYLERIKAPFADPAVVVAAGCVQTRFERTVWERGRSVEYLFGFHWHRPIQQRANSPVVCSGCCSAFRRATLARAGGFPTRTIVEDMDWTWTQQIAGRKAVYVADAVAYAADPDSLTYLRRQVWRWMAGFMQNVRLHGRQLPRAKPMLALWVFLAVFEILTVPLWYAWPALAILWWHQDPTVALGWWLGAELALIVPPLLYACRKRRRNPWQVLSYVPLVYLNKVVNFTYAWKALVVELILVPLGLSRGLTSYQKGRA